MHMKRIATILVAAAMIFGLLPAVAMPASAVTSGTTGDCTWTLDGTVLTISGNGAMKDQYNPWGEEITEVIIESGVTSIGGYLLIGCSSLTSVTIPDSVTSIGNAAFYNCSNLTYYTYDNGLYLKNPNNPYILLAKAAENITSCQIHEETKFIGTGAFTETGLTSIIIPDSVTSIGSDAFSWCGNLNSVTIGDGVTSIGFNAFYSCNNLIDVTIPDGVTSIDHYAFFQCCNLTSITIPGSVTSIAVEAFCSCYGLTSVTIGDGVSSIGNRAFSSCGLTSVTIPGSVTSIGSEAFYWCWNLNSVTIGDGVTSIGDTAFSYCESMTEVVFEGNAPNFGNGVFYNVAATAYYPANNSTWTEEVMQDYGGTITWVPYVAEEESAVEEWNVSLEDDLKVNFYLDGDIAEKAEVTVTVGDSVKTCNISELEKDESGRYIVSVNVAAAQMTDTITVQVDDMEPASYTVRQYCDTILGDESYSQYHQLVKEMLNYGAMAQIYFDHNSENLANNDITGGAAKEVPDTTTDLSFDGETDGVEFYGASLVYRDKIAVRYYYDVTEDASSITFTANGNVYTPVLKDGRYYVEVADILPQDLEQQITRTATDNAGNTLTVCYGPMNYIVRMNQKGSESLKALVKALYNYHLAAKALRTETI